MLFSTNSAIALSGLLCESAMIRIAFQSSPILSLPPSPGLSLRVKREAVTEGQETVESRLGILSAETVERLRADRRGDVAGSIVVVLELMTDCQDVDDAATFDLIEGYIARGLKGNDQLAQERTLTNFAVDERRPAQVSFDCRLDGVDGELRRIKVVCGLSAIQ